MHNTVRCMGHRNVTSYTDSSWLKKSRNREIRIHTAVRHVCTLNYTAQTTCAGGPENKRVGEGGSNKGRLY